ncbi:leucine-rich repeat domain-containing protein [Candidatus Poriferisodalis sp.]|uniref:leucine-rich repeat domain-containing protein n=1 Tax=Candidatus Poriferisodalis sp. TaxID=3101277 RepID=UPI003D14D34E
MGGGGVALLLFAVATVAGPAAAAPDDVVVFNSLNFRAAVDEALGRGTDSLADITEGDMATLTRLDARNRGIGSIGGIYAATDLTYLNLSGNSLESNDLSPLASLTALPYLDLSGNNLSGTNTINLSALTSLKNLYLQDNRIDDINLGSLTALERLDLSNNSIDGNALNVSALTRLKWLDVSDNTISSLNLIDDLDYLEKFLGENNEFDGDFDLPSGITVQQAIDADVSGYLYVYLSGNDDLDEVDNQRSRPGNVAKYKLFLADPIAWPLHDSGIWSGQTAGSTLFRDSDGNRIYNGEIIAGSAEVTKGESRVGGA